MFPSFVTHSRSCKLVQILYTAANCLLCTFHSYFTTTQLLAIFSENMPTLTTGRIANVLSRWNVTNATALFLTGAYTSLLPWVISYSNMNTIRPRSPSSTDPSTSSNQLNSSWTLRYSHNSNTSIMIHRQLDFHNHDCCLKIMNNNFSITERQSSYQLD